MYISASARSFKTPNSTNFFFFFYTNTLSELHLFAQDCFVLDAGTAGLFVWIGRNSSKNEKVQAMNRAQVFLKEHKRPWWSKVRIQPSPRPVRPPCRPGYTLCSRTLVAL